MTWDNIKAKFGYGALKEESKIVDDLSTAVKSRGFDSVVSGVVAELLAQLIEPWIESCFEKYTEEDFHKRMAAGFDFIEDWKTNHPKKYATIIGALRRVRRRMILDENKILAVVVHAMRKKGWTITGDEILRFIQNIHTLTQEIYS
jgi:hypothetical protein